MNIGNTITQIRNFKGIKQSEVADALGIDNSSYSRLEKKGNKITIEQLEIIAKVLSVSISELIGINTEKEELKQHYTERIKVLEASNNDLRLLLQIFEQKIQKAQKKVNGFIIYTILIEYIFDLNIGKSVYYDFMGNVVQEIKHNLPNEEISRLQEIGEKNDWDMEIVLTDNEYKILLHHCIDDQIELKISTILYHLLDTDLINDKVFVDEFTKIMDKRTKAIL